MRGAVLYGPRDLRFDERDTPTILKPTDAIVRNSATCVCGSDLWPYRGINPVPQPTPMGHEYCGIVEEVGSAVTSIKPGQFVIGSFFASDNKCPNCHVGYQSSCQNRELVNTAQAGLLRVPLADGTLVATPGAPPADMVPSLLTLSDVMGTGWFAAAAANVTPGSTVVVVGDGAVGLLGVLSAREMGAGRIVARSCPWSRSPRATAPWTSAARSRRSSAPTGRGGECARRGAAARARGRPPAGVLGPPPVRAPRRRRGGTVRRAALPGRRAARVL